MDYQHFIQADKKDGGKMSQDIISAINPHITSEIGVCAKGFGVSQYDSSDKETQKLMQAMETARLEGEAAVKRAEQLALSIVAEAKGHAEADRIRGAAKIVDVAELAKELIAKGVDPNVAAQAATAVERAERFTRSDSKLTTLVDGNRGASIAIPVKPRGEKE
jgi:regulator of protease activity HflC (stomatin/prohibitin superfamily)